jgi:hypothetical protein
MQVPQPFTLGRAMEECFAAATEDWCRHHAGSMSKEEALAIQLTSVLMQTFYGHGGKVNVTVTISGRRRNEDEVYFWRFQRAANSSLTLLGGSLDL